MKLISWGEPKVMPNFPTGIRGGARMYLEARTLSITFGSLQLTSYKELSKMKLSIVIPHYNRPQKLLACLDSIVANNYPQKNYEVIVIDDCSSQNIDAIINYKKIKNYRFHRLPKNSGSPSEPRNFGIDMANGKRLTFIDSDDTISSGFLEKGMKLAEDGDCDLVFIRRRGRNHPYLNVLRGYSEDAGHIDITTDATAAAVLLYDSMVHSKIYRADIIKKHKIKFDTRLRLCEDNPFTLQTWSLLKTVGICVSEAYHLTPTDEISLQTHSALGPSKIAEVIECTVSNIFNMPDEVVPLDKKAAVVMSILRYPFAQRILNAPDVLYKLKQDIGEHLLDIKDFPCIVGRMRYRLTAILNSTPNGAVKFDYLEWQLGEPLGSGRKIMYRIKDDHRWLQAPSAAHAVADGWMLGITPCHGGYDIYRWHGWDWSRMPGGATQIGGTYEQPWVINDSGTCYLWENGKWKAAAPLV
jgi:glycosyltransferase involved in cell wall biosynthesis